MHVFSAKHDFISIGPLTVISNPILLLSSPRPRRQLMWMDLCQLPTLSCRPRQLVLRHLLKRFLNVSMELLLGRWNGLEGAKMGTKEAKRRMVSLNGCCGLMVNSNGGLLHNKKCCRRNFCQTMVSLERFSIECSTKSEPSVFLHLCGLAGALL